MNVTKPEDVKLKKKQIIIYIAIIAFCIISVIVASYVEFYARIDIAQLIGLKQEESKFGTKTQEEIELLKTEFDNIFNNSIQNDDVSNSNKKNYTDKGLVCTKYEKKESQSGNYDININIPYININNEIIEKYNQEIEDVFVTKARSVLESKNKNIIYTVEYIADVQEDILSLMIKSNLKEGTSAQRVIIQTYNYDLRNNKEISLEEVLRIEQLDKQTIQNKINSEIEAEEKKVADLKQLGYNIYDRDLSSDIYIIENSKEFYLTQNQLYIIYAYGNESFTSEKDLVIL